MDDPALGLEQQTVAIVGLGLMGGSLAMALKSIVKRVLGVDQNPRIVQLAIQRGIVDQASTDPGSILSQADMIIMATPVSVIIEFIPLLPSWKAEGALVIDLGSTKSRICQSLQTLPPSFTAVGGHPMCGKEISSLENAQAGLFEQATFVLVELENSDEISLQLAKTLVKRIGAVPLLMDAQTHDRWVAHTSHFPYLLANVLARITPSESKPLAASGWHSSTRLAGSSVLMMQDILYTNKNAILQVLDQFTTQLGEVRSLLEGNSEELSDFLKVGQTRYHELLTQREDS